MAKEREKNRSERTLNVHFVWVELRTELQVGGKGPLVYDLGEEEEERERIKKELVSVRDVNRMCICVCVCKIARRTTHCTLAGESHTLQG